jgi:hypothetical protein
MTHTQLIDRWFKDAGKHAALRELLDNPIMRDALEILRADAAPQPVTHQMLLQGVRGKDLAYATAQIHATQCGIQRALNRLQQLASPLPQRDENPLEEPFAHVNETYFHPNA